jgi:FkbM family methyltransferase
MNYHKLQEFYSRLADAESRYIFENRVKYLFTGDISVLYDMTLNANKLFHPVKLIYNVENLFKQNDKAIDIIIYGAGKMAGDCLNKLAGMNVLAFCDRDYQSWGAEGHLGLPVISPRELVIKYNNCNVVVSNSLYDKEICDFLISTGRSENSIFLMDGQYSSSNYLHKGSYFQQEFFKPQNEEIYVDAGCYDGDTIKDFVGFCEGNYKKIFGFEPHPVNFQNATENIKAWGFSNVEIIQKGVWSTDDEFSFSLDCKPCAAGITAHGNAIIQTTTIDKIIGDEPVTFIKLDVEGVELEALRGAVNSIKKHKPKLAVCLYHKPEDILEIPEFLYGLVPEYNFYIRHHNYISPSMNINLDTVLYAV